MTKQRIKAMILLHHWALLHRWASNAAKRVSPDTKDLRLVKSWDSAAWGREWPNGVHDWLIYCYKYAKRAPKKICQEYLRTNLKLEALFSEVSWWGRRMVPNLYQGIGKMEFSCSNCRYRLDFCRWCKEYNLKERCRFCAITNTT